MFRYLVGIRRTASLEKGKRKRCTVAAVLEKSVHTPLSNVK
jgi:hypothetical protein